ncbi:MAG: hypothetical protein ABW277_09250 [Longimicrobiaceae bacterium]
MRRAVLLPLVLLAACAPAAAPSPAPRQVGTVTIEDPSGTVGSLAVSSAPRYEARGVAVPLARARAALPAVYEALGLRGGGPTENGYSAPRVQATRALAGVRLSRYLDCGSTVSTANADQYAVTLQVATRLAETTPAATLAETRVLATAKPIGTAGETVACTSTGALEREIARRLEGG